MTTLMKKNVGIDFIIDQGLEDCRLQGENFSAEYNQDKELLQVQIDCRSNLRGRERTNDKIDAESFESKNWEKLKSIKVLDNYFYKKLARCCANRMINSTELILTFNKYYFYSVEIDSGDDEISFVVQR